MCTGIDITCFLQRVSSLILNPVIVLMFVVATSYFVYGVIKFLSADASDKGSGRQEGKNAIIWGIVGMVIMVSVYGIITFILNAFGITYPTTLNL